MTTSVKLALLYNLRVYIYKYWLLYVGQVKDEFPRYKSEYLYIQEYLYNKILVTFSCIMTNIIY